MYVRKQKILCAKEKEMKKKLWLIILAVVMAFGCMFSLAACKDDKDKNDISKFDGEYIVYMPIVDADGKITGLHESNTTVKCENGKVYMGEQSITIKIDGDGFSYEMPKYDNPSETETFKFVKAADGEYYCLELSTYICKKDKTPSYPVDNAE